jgi:hypothetical protein
MKSPSRKYVGTPSVSNLYGDLRAMNSPIDRDGPLGVGDASNEPQPMPRIPERKDQEPEIE